MPIVRNTQAGSFVADGAYVFEQAAQPVTPTGPNTSLVAVVGTASWGPLNVPTGFNNAGSMYANFGTGTLLKNSLVDEAFSAMPECQQFIGLRVSDTTDVKATLNIVDSVPANVLVLTAVYTGSYANTATARVDLQSGTATVSPVYRITISFPNTSPIVYSGIIGYATLGSAYSASTFQANAIAAINGTASNSTANPYFVASAGASTAAPVVGTNFTATGGADGASAITTTQLLGVDGNVARSGVYALRGAAPGGTLIVAQLGSVLADLSIAQSLLSFAIDESMIVGVTLPKGDITNVTTLVTDKNSGPVSSQFGFVAGGFYNRFDPVAGTTRFVSPLGKVAGIIASTPAYIYPGNKPQAQAALGVIGTERTAGVPLSLADKGILEGAGIIALDNTFPRNGVFGTLHGIASDGSTQLSDTRMLNAIALSLEQILANFVGQMQSNDLRDQTRAQARAAIVAYLQSLVNPVRQIDSYQITLDTTNNTSVSIAQGFLIANVLVKTLSGVRFALATLQVGTTVQIQVSAGTLG